MAQEVMLQQYIYTTSTTGNTSQTCYESAILLSILYQVHFWSRAQDDMPGNNGLLENVRNSLQATKNIKTFHALRKEEVSGGATR